MKIENILIEAEQRVTGTNCSNCRFVGKKAAPIKPDELNPHGGMKAPDEKHLKMAKHADLVTLPGTAKPSEKHFCKNKEVDQYVNKRMCCAYWDAVGVYREFKK